MTTIALFFKSHIDGYTRADGTFVAPHEDKRAAAKSISPVQRQTNTSEFNGWFRGSKVVDGDGNPLVVYHATTSEFSEFRDNSHFGTSKQANEILSYQQRKDEGGSKILPVYLSIKNPLRVEDDGGVDWDKVSADAKSKGHDGLVYQNWGEFDPDNDGNPRDSYIAFSGSQIKSATGNNGKFDGRNTDITKSLPVIFAVSRAAPD